MFQKMGGWMTKQSGIIVLLIDQVSNGFKKNPEEVLEMQLGLIIN